MTIPQEEAAVRLPPFCFRLPAVFSPLLSAPPRGASFAALRPGLLSAIPTVPSVNRPLRRTIRHRFPFPTRRTGKHPHAPTAFPSSRPTRFQPNASPKNSALTESGRISSPGPPLHETYGKNRRVRRGLAPRRSPALPDASREKPSGKKIHRPAALIRKRTTPRAGACLRTAGLPGEKLRRRKSRLILESYKKDLFSCRFADTETASANGSKGRKPERHDTGATQRPALFP